MGQGPNAGLHRFFEPTCQELADGLAPDGDRQALLRITSAVLSASCTAAQVRP